MKIYNLIKTNNLISFIFQLQEWVFEGSVDVCVGGVVLEMGGSKPDKLVLHYVLVIIVRERQMGTRKVQCACVVVLITEWFQALELI